MITEEQIQKVFDNAVKDCCRELNINYLPILNFISKEKFISLVKNIQSVKTVLSSGVFKDFAKQCPYFIYRHDNLIDRIQTKLTNRFYISIQMDILNTVYKDFPIDCILEMVRQNVIYELACKEYDIMLAKSISEKYVCAERVKNVNKEVWNKIFLSGKE